MIFQHLKVVVHTYQNAVFILHEEIHVNFTTTVGGRWFYTNLTDQKTVAPRH